MSEEAFWFLLIVTGPLCLIIARIVFVVGIRAFKADLMRELEGDNDGQEES